MSETKEIISSQELLQEDIKRKKEIINTLIDRWILKHEDTPTYILRDDRYPKYSWKIVAIDSDYDWDIDSFYKNNKSIDHIFNLEWLRNQYYYLSSIDLAWVREKNWEWNKGKLETDKPHQMFPLDDKAWLNEIKQDSLEFYMKCRDIAFYGWKMLINKFIRYLHKWDHTKLTLKFFKAFLRSESIRIDDLILFRENDWIDDDIFNFALPKIIAILPQQCADMRFDRALKNMDTHVQWNISEELIDEYVNNEKVKLPEQVANQCKEIIRNRADYAEKKKRQEEITKRKLEREKKKNQNK